MRGACGTGLRLLGRGGHTLCFVSFEGLFSDFMFLKVMLVLEIEVKRFYEEFFHSVLVTN